MRPFEPSTRSALASPSRINSRSNSAVLASASKYPGQISWDYDRAEIIADGAVHAIGVCLGKRNERQHRDIVARIPSGLPNCARSRMHALMLRLNRRFGPLRRCRWFNALQIRGQGRALHVLIARAFGVDRRRIRWIFNSP